MDTKNQQWFCEICNKNYGLKRKDKHLLTQVHKKNKKRLEHEEELEDYEIRRDVLMMENIADMDFEEFEKKYKLVDKLVDKQLKKEFGRTYQVHE